MTNEKAPERIYMHPTSAEANINPWPLEPGEYVEYVRADLAVPASAAPVVDEPHKMNNFLTVLEHQTHRNHEYHPVQCGECLLTETIANRIREQLGLSRRAAAATAAPQQPRSNHFPDEALNKGFPDHISRDGTAYYSDGTVLPSAAPVEQKIDEATMDWALRELADGWIQNNEREGPHGFYQNARRVLNAIVS